MKSPLLDQFTLIDTSNLEAVRAALTRVYSAPTLEFVGRERSIHAIVNFCQLQRTRISYATFAANLKLDFPGIRFVSVVMAVGGRSEIALGGQSALLNRDFGAVLSPGHDIRVTHDAEYERVMLTMDSRALASKLSAIIGRSVDERWKFSIDLDCTSPSGAALRRHLLFLADKANKAVASIPDIVLAEFEQLLMVMLLQAARHNYSELLERTPPDSAPWQVRRAEEFMAANWRQAMTLEGLAEITGVGVLSLFRSFKRMRGYSPLEFLSRMRSRRGVVLQ